MDKGTPFGKWLKNRRKGLGLTQVELALCVGCSPRTVIQIELGQRRPSKQMAELLARCVNVSPGEVGGFVDFARMAGSDETGAAREQSALGLLQREVANNLPSPPAAFIGREREIEAACALLKRSEVRLVTMTGAPGIGKTRLSLQVARTLAREAGSASSSADGDEPFRDGIYFIALESVRDPRLVASSIARTLQLGESAGQPIEGHLKEILRHRRTLLVLDNFEQVVQAAPFLGELLAAAPALKMLVTSREALRLYGEYEFQVQALSLPDPLKVGSIERLLKYDAVRLFTARAAATRLDFGMTAENAALVARICTQLEGLPLPIELAASRVRDLTLEEIAERLRSKLSLLVNGPRDRSARQQTLRGALEWSYELLNEDEQVLFRSLSVFAGGFTLEAAEEVCGPVDTLSSLVEKSLLQLDTTGGSPRWHMLETIREYAAWQLADISEEQDTQRAHAAYYLAVAEKAAQQLQGKQQAEWLERLEYEHSNLRAALGYWVEREQAGEALRMSVALWRYWLVRGYVTEGRALLENGLALARKQADVVAPALLAGALNGAGNLAYTAGDYPAALALHTESLDIRRELGDRQGMAGALNNIAVVWRDQGDLEQASGFFEASLAIKRELGDETGVASTLNNLGVVKQRQSSYDAACASYEESLRIWRNQGNKFGVATALSNLGVVEGYKGNYAAAMSLHEESLAIRRDVGDKMGIANSLANIATVALATGDYERARTLHEENLAARRERGDRPGIAHSLFGLGQAARRQGNLAEAKRHISESLAIWAEVGNKQGIAEALYGLAGIAAAETVDRHGQTNAEPALRRAAILLGAARALTEATGFQLPPEEAADLSTFADRVREQLGDSLWAELEAQGRAMTLEQAVRTAGTADTSRALYG